VTDTLPVDAAATAPPDPAPRTVVIHYHLFKNAGTSLDQAFQTAFGERWTGFEGNGRKVLPAELTEYVLANDALTVVSSHVAHLPVPEIPGVRVIPVIFVRHPLDRIRSSYDFERIQQVDTPGARLARENDLRGYFEKRLAMGDRSVRSFQTWRLGMGGSGATELERALDTVRRLPFVGLVEQYPQSLARLTALLGESFPGLTLTLVHHNRAADAVPEQEGRLARMRDDLGEEGYTRLLDANQDDLVLWQAVRASYQA
jgi:hypothetical protein